MIPYQLKEPVVDSKTFLGKFRTFGNKFLRRSFEEWVDRIVSCLIDRSQLWDKLEDKGFI